MNSVLYKKMKRLGKRGLKGTCECGKVFNFTHDDFNTENKSFSLLYFNKVVKCDQCGNNYDGLYDDLYNKPGESKYSPIGLLISSILILGLLFGGYTVVKNIFKGNESTPTNISNMTHKQYDEFMKWQDDQAKKKYDNSKVGTNN